MKRKRTSDAISTVNGYSAGATDAAAQAIEPTSPTPTFPSPVTLRVPETPSKRLTRNATHQNDAEGTASPSPQKISHYETPQKRNPSARFTSGTASPPAVGNADKSARRKSVRQMVSRALDSDATSDGDDDGEDELAQRIFLESDGSSGSEPDDEEQPEQPKERVGRKKGLSKAKRKEATPPPPSVDSVDSYFHQNRKVLQQTSTATLASLPQLDHTTYYQLLRPQAEDHAMAREALIEDYEDAFLQWEFELSEGFNILLYGYGSKRKLLTSFVSKLYTTPGSVIIVNGYIHNLSIKDILNTIYQSILGANSNPSLGSNPSEQLENLLALLSEPEVYPFVLGFHNIDGEVLRNERTQAAIARLAAHPKVSLVASIDHIRAPLLWDAARMSQFNFLWHDATTYEPYGVEIPADEALSLTDGSGRVGGTKGVKYVLASLPNNARSLFRVLVNHQLDAMLDDKSQGKAVGGEECGIEYRVLYQKAVSEFICSNDVAFRTLLKEFQDHQMIASKKNAQGTEVLWAPFRREDLENILEDAVA